MVTAVGYVSHLLNNTAGGEDIPLLLHPLIIDQARKHVIIL